MRKTVLLGIFLSCLFVFGCRDSQKESGPAESTWLVGFSQCTFEDPWRINMNNEMEAAASSHPELRLMISNGENKNAKQIADVENFIVRGVDLLIISPREAAPLTPVVEKAYDRGIPVIVLDRALKTEKYTCFIGASNLEIGRDAGKYVAEKLGEGKIVEIEGILGATPTQERRQGFHEVADKHPSLEIIYRQPGDYKRSPAKRVMEDALQSFPVIDAVYAHNDEMAIGAFLAARAVGREKDMIFVGIDGQGEAVQMIRNGQLHATFVYKNGSAEAIEYGLKILNGETVPKTVSLSAIRVTKEEALDYKGF